MEDLLCVYCLNDGKYQNGQIICKKCFGKIQSCVRCPKKVCDIHQKGSIYRYICQDCITPPQMEETSEEEEDLEEEEEYDEEYYEEEYFEEGGYYFENEFIINNFITLKLRNDGVTIIFMESEEFDQCKYLLIHIPADKVESINEYKSIDEVEEKLGHDLEPQEGRVDLIPPETEFWGHCSNLQAWAENNYDTRILHRNLAFPLLKRLTEIGDSVAKKVFKEEIAKRIENGCINVVLYLIEQNYLKHLNKEEMEVLFENPESNIYKNLIHALMNENKKESNLAIRALNKIRDLKIKIGRK